MHTPAIVFAMLLGTVGVPLAGVFVLLLIGTLFYRRTRLFASRLLVSSLVIGLVAAAAMWVLALASLLPAPFHYQAALTVFPFGFAVGGMVQFFRLWKQTKAEVAK